jgi:RNA polymerase sigma-70 factor (ECF subfamily)
VDYPADDKVLIKNFKRGDVKSFDLIFEKYHKKIYHFALGFLKNREDAEEITQEVFLNLWKSRGQINEQYVFSSYLFRIAFNAVHKFFRKKLSERDHLEAALENLVHEDYSTNIDIEYNNLLEITYNCADQLPRRQKEIFLMNFKDHLSNEEIAQKLNVTRKTVDNYLSKARSFIKASISDKGLISLLYIILFLY